MKKIRHFLKHILPIIFLGLVLSGCASTKGTGTHTKQADKEATSNISFAPAIDVPYSEVASNIKPNIGLNVRWGGRVIKSTAIDETTTRLTVYSYPLSSDGRPIGGRNVHKKTGQFIVDLTDGFVTDVDFNGHFLTFYGGVSGEQLVTNGNRQKTIPIVNAEELVDWNMVDGNTRNVNNSRGNSYYALGHKTGHFGFGSSFGHSFHGGSRFGFFSRGRSFKRFGGRGFRGRSFGSFRGRGFRGRSFGGFRGRGFRGRR